ncbi:putative xaa-Pro dipeptidase [Helianthus annuus]|nr:putative xaa-Pro dipeptidase [Helianthus annuus]
MASLAMDSSSSASLLHPPPAVPTKLYAENREKLLKHLREYLNSSSRPLKGFVLLQGGEEQTRYCTDHEDLFRYFSSFALT